MGVGENTARQWLPVGTTRLTVYAKTPHKERDHVILYYLVFIEGAVFSVLFQRSCKKAVLRDNALRYPFTSMNQPFVR